LAPVSTLAWRNVDASTLDCFVGTRSRPNWLLCIELNPERTRMSLDARSMFE
jgi:hypothetical protein